MWCSYIAGKKYQVLHRLGEGVSGIVKNGVELPKNGFAMKLTALVEADHCTGYFAVVKREVDKEQR